MEVEEKREEKDEIEMGPKRLSRVVETGRMWKHCSFRAANRKSSRPSA